MCSLHYPARPLGTDGRNRGDALCVCEGQRGRQNARSYAGGCLRRPWGEGGRCQGAGGWDHPRWLASPATSSGPARSPGGSVLALLAAGRGLQRSVPTPVRTKKALRRHDDTPRSPRFLIPARKGTFSFSSRHKAVSVLGDAWVPLAWFVSTHCAPSELGVSCLKGEIMGKSQE